MHLVIGAGQFLGGHVSRALAADVPVIELSVDADDETLADAISAADVIINCAESWSPARRPAARAEPPRLLQRMVEAARRAHVRRIVHVSTAGVYGHSLKAVDDKAIPHPVHAYARLRRFEERWLLDQASGLDVVIVRPAHVFGAGEPWILPPAMAVMATGRLWLPGGGRVTQSFVSASDVGRACLAASDRGRPGRAYVVAGFDATWRDLFESAAHAAGFVPEFGDLPYDLVYLRSVMAETFTRRDGVAWPSVYLVDVLGRPHRVDDSASRRQLTWSPSVGSFEQEMPAMAPWLASLPEVASLLASAAAESAKAT